MLRAWGPNDWTHHHLLPVPAPCCHPPPGQNAQVPSLALAVSTSRVVLGHGHSRAPSLAIRNDAPCCAISGVHLPIVIRRPRRQPYSCTALVLCTFHSAVLLYLLSKRMTPATFLCCTACCASLSRAQSTALVVPLAQDFFFAFLSSPP